MAEDQCEMNYVHEDKVKDAKSFLNTPHTLEVLDLFSAIGDSKKLTILLALFKEERLCVCDLATLLNMSIASTSHHLRTLYKKDIVAFEKEGKMAYYNIQSQAVKQLLQYALALESD